MTIWSLKIWGYNTLNFSHKEDVMTSKLEEAVNDLNPNNLARVYNCVLNIDEVYQFCRASDILLPYWPKNIIPISQSNDNDDDLYSAWFAEQDPYAFLKNTGVIFRFNIIGSPDDHPDACQIDVGLNPTMFKECKKLLQQRYLDSRKDHSSKENETSSEAGIYEIKYANSREIILNGFLLSRLNFDSENHIVFEYVYKNPNREISTDEIEENLQGRELSKTLPKIVENWGFTGQLKKVFFDVSKSKIKFRNPISNKELMDFNIERLRFPRSGNAVD